VTIHSHIKKTELQHLLFSRSLSLTMKFDIRSLIMLTAIVHYDAARIKRTRNVNKTDSAVTDLLSDSMASSKDLCNSIHSLQCKDEDITSLPGVKTSAECCQACQNQAGCNAWTWDWYSSEKLCHLKSACNFQRTTSSGYHSGIAQYPHPIPTPNVPAPRPASTPAPTSNTNVPHHEKGPYALIDEYNDRSMGIAVTMIDRKGWKSGKWGIMGAPAEYDKDFQSFVSIMTREQRMSVYQRRSYGLALHITPNNDFWQFFQVIREGDKKGQIVGGPGDGGSHTPGSASYRLGLHAAGKGYEWFKRQKNGILAKYNTVYGNSDYNEFITNGLSWSSVAGIFRNVRSHSDEPTDKELCQFMRGGRWPVYAYDRKSSSPLKIDRYLDC